MNTPLQPATRSPGRGRTLRSLAGGTLVFGLAWALLPATELHAAASRPGRVQFSNGDIVEGAISLTPGSEFKLHTGTELKSLDLAVVREVRLTPEKEAMEQKWRFVEAGRTQKERWGRPYPVRELAATVWFGDGQTIRGHVYTTVLYVEGADGNTKVVLRAKDRGNEGQTFQDIVYPTRVVFTDTPESPAGSITLTIRDPRATQVAALTGGTLLSVTAIRLPQTGRFSLSGLAASNVFLAVRSDEGIRVGWPADRDTNLTARIQRAMSDVDDFFDSRELLGVQRMGDDVYTLFRLSRKGQTTLGAEKSQPWRAEIWRWKDTGDQVMVAGRGYFFRGIIGKGESPPPVVAAPELWRPGLTDGIELP